MSKQRTSVFFFALCCFIGCFFTPVFIASIIRDQRAESLESFELIARVVGYALVLAVNALTGISAYRRARQGAWHRTAGFALLLSLVSVVILCVHDVLLFDAYGNQLEGTFTLSAFFAMDAALLALYPVAIFLFHKRPEKSALRGVLAAIVFVWALYMVGDMAGYPASQITDWDEAMIKFILMYSALYVFSPWHQNAAQDGMRRPVGSCGKAESKNSADLSTENDR